MPAMSSSVIVPATCSGVELRAVQFGVDEVGDQVVARVGHVVADVLEEVVELGADALDPLVRWEG